MVIQMNRYHAIQKLMSIVDEKVVIVGNLGPTSDEMRHARHRDKNFYTYGSMGLCSSIALGIALNYSDKVISFDGDGSVLMNMGTLATIGRENPLNLIVLIWDNEMWGQVGRQFSHTHYQTNLEEIAQGCGIKKTITVDNEDDLEKVFVKALSDDGPYVIVAKIKEREYLSVAPVEPEIIAFNFRKSMIQNA